MRRMCFMTVLLVAAAAQVARAQEQRREAPRPVIDSATIAEIRRILRLPQTTERARQAGVPDSQVRDVLRRTRERGVPAEDAQRTIEQETEAVERGGDRGEFGKFVQSQIDAGLRGRELSEAIRAEHARRGIGKPKGEGAGAQPGRGRAEEAKPKPPTRLDSTKRVERRRGQ
jgi:hypothetical protein